jgi:phosphoribosylformylglycinamidine synthase II
MSTPATQSSSPSFEVQNTQLWQIELRPAPGQPDRLAEKVLDSARDLGFADSLKIAACRGFLLQGELVQGEVLEIAAGLLAEPVVERFQIGLVGAEKFNQSLENLSTWVYVLSLPGVTDPEADSALMALRELGYSVQAVRTFRRYWLSNLPAGELQRLTNRVLYNGAIEAVWQGELQVQQLFVGQSYQFQPREVPLSGMTDDQLVSISQQWGLSLSLVEMQTIRNFFQERGRTPTDIELETIAQTWSEHCSHKTLAGRIRYQDENGERLFNNMLKETIFAATLKIKEKLAERDWCVSVFKDNAGIVRFDDQFNVSFKVETHNRPSALEPYGGANTGIGGVIRDTLGTGMGAKPVCNTDVFCFAPPDTPHEQLPPGVMHPRMIMKGVVAGVRDYGNRMGIPTVNGAVYFDPRYLGNPLVFCGNVGLVPADKSFKQPQPNDLIVSIGGRTGRDGIHGATFSSAELTETSDVTSGGAVQIGNAITEKMLMDVLLKARDLELYHAVTDCGAGGYSSAVGEMGEEIGAEVWLDQVPLKYQGLSYTEIWISEAQERMVLAVPQANWDRFRDLCAAESVEATVIGQFKPTGVLELKYHEHTVGKLPLDFLHQGRPQVVRTAVYQSVDAQPLRWKGGGSLDFSADLIGILGSWNVASKHWIIRQYDHEVQGGSVLKPLVGIQNDGPGDAAIVRPRLDSRRGIVIACGMNPHYGDLDPYHSAASAIDEALRNCVAVGADPQRIAILDNFSWGHTDRPSTLGSLVRAAIACHDYSLAFQTPFISGKDSLHNEFSYTDPAGDRQTISIPATLLISALGQIENVAKAVSMDLKRIGNLVYQLGMTGDHLGGSHWSLIRGATGGAVPTVDASLARRIFQALHSAMRQSLVRSCHDLSEGGLAVAIAEMCFSGGLGARLDLKTLPAVFPRLAEGLLDPVSGTTLVKLFAESNSRFLVEVAPADQTSFEACFASLPCYYLGQVTAEPQLVIEDSEQSLIDLPLAQLKAAWQQPLDWK